jgi:oligopeptide/dipeptide ABC transporter ATP-binding protein
VDLNTLRGPALRPYRRRMQIIFQDPFASLDPRTPIGDSIGEGLRIHATPENQWRSSAVRRRRVERMMDMVGLASYYARRYPHEFSGGQRQRIGIARALVLEPDLVVCDEPVSALDVSIQAQVLNLLKALQRELGLTYLFIAHNMGVVEHVSDRVAVMYLGRVAELATRETMFRTPEHPYTQALFSAIPIPDPEVPRRRIVLEGDVPSPLNPPTGCLFHPRCGLRAELGAPASCSDQVPDLRDAGGDHLVACHFRGAAAVGHAGARGPRTAGSA